MNTGSAFYIGKTHKVCEDYTCHGLAPEPYILVSDGCSSSPKTDFGSRILVQVSSDLFEKNKDFDIEEVLLEAEELRRLFNISQESLDATLLGAYVKGDEYHLLMCGDGVLVKTKHDGTMEVVLIEYPSGAPFYLSYNLNQTRKTGYIKHFTLEKKISTWQIQPDGAIENLLEREYRDDNHYQETGSCKDYKSISLMSDGVVSFYELLNTGTSKSENPILVHEVLKKLLDFKGFQGEFVERRVQKFRKECEKMNWYHADDISLATIFLGEVG